MKTPYLVHHAVYDEVAAAPCSLFLEHIDEHDVYHCLHKNVCSVRPYIVDALHPTCVVVVLHHSELKPEGVTQGDGRARSATDGRDSSDSPRPYG